MKKFVSILFILYFFISDISSQNLSKMTISAYECNVPPNICKDGNLGILVFFSGIKNLGFEAISPDTGGNAIVNIEYQNSDNRYILCVKPQNETNFSVKISADRFYPETYVVGSLRAKEKKCFTIYTDYPEDKTVEITVLSADDKPLDNALIEIKGKITEHTNSKGVGKIELPNTELTTLFISHKLYEDIKAISVRLGDKQSVRLEQLKVEEDSNFIESSMRWFQEGVKNSNVGKYSEAIRCYSNALDKNPNMSDAWYNLGIAYGREKKKYEAAECYQKAAKLGNKEAQKLLRLMGKKW